MNLCKDCTDIAFCVRERGVRINRYKVVFEGGAVRILDVIQSPGAHLSGSDAFLMNGFPRLLLQLEILLNFGRVGRSEEHTSELQSRLHLVCRLLLEKKKHA